MAESKGTTKMCSKCGEEKTPDKFHRRRASKDGRQSICMSCKKDHQNSHRGELATYRASRKDKAKVVNAAYRAANLDRLRANEAAYASSHRTQRNASCRADYAAKKAERRSAKRVYRAEHREELKAKAAAYRATPEGRLTQRRASIAHRRKYPERDRARAAVHIEIRAGRLTPGPCEACGLTPKKVNGRQRIEAHHHKGYEEEHALDVVWLCAPCHREADVE